MKNKALKSLLIAIAIFSLEGSLPVRAQAPAWPSQPIRLMVPFSAGGGADNAARIVGRKLGERLGQPVVIENRPGAGGVIAESALAQALPDGYTMLYDSFALAVNATRRNLSFDPRTDLVPVTSTATAETVLVANPRLPVRTVKELVAYAKANPGKVSYASAGVGSVAHLSGEMLASDNGLNLLHVPYKGGGQAITDLMGGQVDIYFAAPTSTLASIKGGKLRALAVTSPERADYLPELPTMVELGYPDFVMETWHGLFVPRGTPPEILSRIDRETQAVLADPEVQKLMRASGLTPRISDQPTFARFVDAQITRWSRFLKDRDIQID
ncbi:tripartite tricarboxylate transporter substrate binding protein [Pigmentiphaga soli]|uniref:Tripartite tricarboxylate transporter substrate binding protein n=1 Tax=Pigmentiphaga soli TaxID=1007095 RepID=A0ABP8H792_9BURK